VLSISLRDPSVQPLIFMTGSRQAECGSFADANLRHGCSQVAVAHDHAYALRPLHQGGRHP